MTGIATLATIVFLLCGYLGGYFALVEPNITVAESDTGLIGVSVEDHYRVGGRFAESVFWPINQLDRNVRTEKWQLPNLPTPAIGE